MTQTVLMWFVLQIKVRTASLWVFQSSDHTPTYSPRAVCIVDDSMDIAESLDTRELQTEAARLTIEKFLKAFLPLIGETWVHLFLKEQG